jgi:hypothetical protein
MLFWLRAVAPGVPGTLVGAPDQCSLGIRLGQRSGISPEWRLRADVEWLPDCPFLSQAPTAPSAHVESYDRPGRGCLRWGHTRGESCGQAGTAHELVLDPEDDAWRGIAVGDDVLLEPLEVACPRPY